VRLGLAEVNRSLRRVVDFHGGSRLRKRGVQGSDKLVELDTLAAVAARHVGKVGNGKCGRIWTSSEEGDNFILYGMR
jgi:hypothetical protein